MRTAIYARVSTETQEKEHTIGSQLEALREYAVAHELQVVAEFTDEGYSGARLDRPALDRMRNLAEDHGFEVLLTYCSDRLARKFVLQALILDELERFGVKTIFLEGGAADDPLSKLMHQITGAVAEFERAKIAERYRRGRLYRARCGEFISASVPFGYRRVPRRDGVAAHAEIVESEASIVRHIFDAYVNRGLTVRQIAKRLTLDHVATPKRAKQWHGSVVAEMLRAEAYIGTCYYNRHQYLPVAGVLGQKHQRYQVSLRPREEWIPISVPPIIDLATFQAAASRVRENEIFSPRNSQVDRYLLRRLVCCGHCGSSLVGLTTGRPLQSYYRCHRRLKSFLKHECVQPGVRAAALDQLIWEEVSTRLQDPSLVLAAYQEHKTQRPQSVAAGTATEQDTRLNTQIKFALKEISRLLDAYQSGAIELAELQKRRQLVDAKLAMLEREKTLLAKAAAEQKKEADLQTSLTAFARVVTSSLQHVSFAEKQKLLRIVLDKVVIKNWRVEVHYNIPLPKPESKVSTQFNLRPVSRC
ncbi:MAG TPA: recombinase family protein [Pyrinomonadaceae bacterium]|nr:recombinase family protein [Pyrinomonadaceae bacterium]